MQRKLEQAAVLCMLQVMLEAIKSAAVGVLLLYGMYLDKGWPMRKYSASSWSSASACLFCTTPPTATLPSCSKPKAAQMHICSRS